MSPNHTSDVQINISDKSPNRRDTSVRGIPESPPVRGYRSKLSNRAGLSSLFHCRVRPRAEPIDSSSPTGSRFTSRSRQTVPGQSSQSTSITPRLNLSVDIGSEHGIKSHFGPPVNGRASNIETAATFEAHVKVLMDENARLRTLIDDLQSRLDLTQTASVPPADPDSSFSDKLQISPNQNDRVHKSELMFNSEKGCAHGNNLEGLNEDTAQLRTRLAEVSKENERLCKMMGDLRIRGVDRMRQLEEERDELEERLSSSRDTCQALEVSLMQLRDWSMRCLRRKDEAAENLRRENFSSQAEVERLNRLILDLRSRLSERNYLHLCDPSLDDYEDNAGFSDSSPASLIAVGFSEDDTTNEFENPLIAKTSGGGPSIKNAKLTEVQKEHAITPKIYISSQEDSKLEHNDGTIHHKEEISEALKETIHSSGSQGINRATGQVDNNGTGTELLSTSVSTSRNKRRSLDSMLPNNHLKFTVPSRGDLKFKNELEEKKGNTVDDCKCSGNDDLKTRSWSLDRVRIANTTSCDGSSGVIDSDKEVKCTARNRKELEKITRARSFSVQSPKQSPGKETGHLRKKCERRLGTKNFRSGADTIVRFQIDEKVPVKDPSKTNDVINVKADGRERTSLKSRTWLEQKCNTRCNNDYELDNTRLPSESEKISEATRMTSTASLGKHSGDGGCERQTDRTDTLDLKNPLMSIRREQIIVGQFCQHAIDIVRKLLAGKVGAVEKEDELKEIIEVEWEKWIARLQNKEDLVTTVEGWVRNCFVVNGLQYDVVHSFNSWYGKQYSLYKERASAGAAIIATNVGVPVMQHGRNDKNISPVPKVLPAPHKSETDDRINVDEPDSGAFEDALAVDDEEDRLKHTHSGDVM